MKEISLARDLMEIAARLSPSSICWAVERLKPYDALANANSIYKEELKLLSPERAQQFLAGRSAADRVLMALDKDLSGSKIGRLPTGAPHWPEGVAGSITHQGDIALAAAARKSDFLTLGIDLQRKLSSERDDRLLRRISDATELEMLKSAHGAAPGSWIFSAKEAAFKALGARGGKGPVTSLKLCSVPDANFLNSLFQYKPHGREGAFLNVISMEVGGGEYYLSLALPA